jgi:hypothetical protein
VAEKSIWNAVRYNLPLIFESQSQGVTTWNEVLHSLDVLVQSVAEGVARLNPPTLPTERYPGALYVVGTSGTALGDWTGREGEITFWALDEDGAGEWRFLGLRPEGFMVWNKALPTPKLQIYNGSIWKTVTSA